MSSLTSLLQEDARAVDAAVRALAARPRRDPALVVRPRDRLQAAPGSCRSRPTAGPPGASTGRAESGDGYDAWALQIVELGEGGIEEFTFFLDTERLFPLFGLPLRLEP